MGARVPGLRLGNKDLQSVSTDAKQEESTKPREANEKLPRSFRAVAVELDASESRGPREANETPT